MGIACDTMQHYAKQCNACYTVQCCRGVACNTIQHYVTVQHNACNTMQHYAKQCNACNNIYAIHEYNTMQHYVTLQHNACMCLALAVKWENKWFSDANLRNWCKTASCGGFAEHS